MTIPKPTEILYDDGSVALSIRPLRKEDAPAVNEAVHESLENLLTFMDWAHGELNEQGQLNRIVRSNQNYLNGSEYDFGVFDRSGNFLVSASLLPSKTRNKTSFEIGYWTHAQHCNKGYATLVTKILTFVAFEFMGCDRVDIGCNHANDLSKRVIEKCGFIYDGKVRNYFSKPTEAMLKRGYSPERTSLLFGLTSDDLTNLPWYAHIKKHTQVS